MKIELGVSCPACGQLNTVEMSRDDFVCDFMKAMLQDTKQYIFSGDKKCDCKKHLAVSLNVTAMEAV